MGFYAGGENQTPLNLIGGRKQSNEFTYPSQFLRHDPGLATSFAHRLYCPKFWGELGPHCPMAREWPPGPGGLGAFFN